MFNRGVIQYLNMIKEGGIQSLNIKLTYILSTLLLNILCYITKYALRK